MAREHARRSPAWRYAPAGQPPAGRVAGGARNTVNRALDQLYNAARARRDALLAGWPAAVPGCAPLPEVHAGLHPSVRCESLAREQALIAAAARVGVEINPLSVQWLPEGNTPPDQRAGLLMGFAAVPEQAISEALQALRRAWKLPG